MDPSAPLLFFDSGVGGLSVLEPTRGLLPTAPIVYAADSAGYPYGTRSEAEIASRVPALLGRLVERFQPRLVVIACNTACTIALDQVRFAEELPLVALVASAESGETIDLTGQVAEDGTLDWVAPPGHSMHERGLAVDLGGDLARAVQLIDELDLPLHRPLANEPWHFELIGSR